MHVMENKNSLAITTLPDYNVRGHAVLRQERKFAYHVPDAVQAMDISRQEMLKIVASKTGSGFCAELPYADFLYQYSICNILAVMQVNIYAKHTYARTRSQRCTIERMAKLMERRTSQGMKQIERRTFQGMTKVTLKMSFRLGPQAGVQKVF